MRRGSWTLVELLVVCAILVGLAIWLLPRYLTGTPASEGQKAAPAPTERARGVECMNNLRQIRSAITMARQSSENEAPPPSLQELGRQGIPSQMLFCPVSKRPYGYQPATGQVWCTLPEHQRY
jgi:type II secretory pathway pseudopilin PulG